MLQKNVPTDTPLPHIPLLQGLVFQTLNEILENFELMDSNRSQVSHVSVKSARTHLTSSTSGSSGLLVTTMPIALYPNGGFGNQK